MQLITNAPEYQSAQPTSIDTSSAIVEHIDQAQRLLRSSIFRRAVDRTRSHPNFDINTMRDELYQLTCASGVVWISANMLMLEHLLSLAHLQGKVAQDKVHARVDDEHQLACWLARDTGEMYRQANELYARHALQLWILLCLARSKQQ